MSSFERRLDRLDEAFLFLLSFVGLVITIIQVYLFEISVIGLLETMPLLFLGIVMPFYVGYMRGAISVNLVNRSVVERMRGWVYLILGVSAYIGHTLALHLHYWIFGISVPYNLSIIIGLVLIYFLLKWFNGVFQIEYRRNITHEYALSGTVISALLFPFFLRMFVSIYSDLQPTFQYSPLLMLFMWFTLTMTWIFFVYEKVSRNIINVHLPLKTIQIERRQQRNVILRFAIYYVDIGVFALRISRSSTFLWIQGLIIGILGFFLLFLGIPVFPDAFLLTAIVFHFLGTVHFLRSRIDSSQL